MKTSTENAIRLHAMQEFPRECCGVVIVRKGREKYIPCRNIDESPNDAFIIDPHDFLAAEEQGEVVAIVHSHVMVSPQPSDADKVGCENSGVEWHIVHVYTDEQRQLTTGKIVSFKPCGWEAPLVGRAFHYGVLDCWELVRDWYRRERNIELPRYESTDKWWERGEKLYERYFDECFDRVAVKDIQVGDVIFMQTKWNWDVNHAGVYIGDCTVLHHMYNRLSSRDIYGGMLQDQTRFIGRYRGQK